jgi:hypothetical protein
MKWNEMKRNEMRMKGSSMQRQIKCNIKNASQKRHRAFCNLHEAARRADARRANLHC